MNNERKPANTVLTQEDRDAIQVFSGIVMLAGGALGAVLSSSVVISEKFPDNLPAWGILGASAIALLGANQVLSKLR